MNKVSLYDVLDDFSHCIDFEDCDNCKAFIKIENLDNKTGETLRNDFCELLRLYKRMLADAINEEIDRL